MFESPLLIQCLVFLVVTGALLVASALAIGNDRLIDQRIRGLTAKAVRPRGTVREWLASQGMKIPWVTEALLPGSTKQRPRLQTRLIEAGIYAPWAVSAYVAARCLLTLALPAGCLAAAALGWIPPTLALLSASLAGIAGIFLPKLWLERRRARWHSTLRRALPDFLDLVVACLAGGLSMQAALKKVSEELTIAHPDLTSELLIVLREIEIGRTLDHALQQMAARTGLEELRMLCSFVHQTSKFGTTITDALLQLAEALRIQREQRAEELAQKAAVKILFPTLLFIFPTVFVVLAGPAAIQINESLLAASRNDAAPMHSK